MITVHLTADTAPISMLANLIWPHYFVRELGLLPQEQVDYMLRQQYSLPALKARSGCGEQFALLEERTFPVGWASTLSHPVGVQIKSAFLMPNWRGRGIFRDHILPIAEGRGLPIFLYVNRNNLPAIRAYERAGFIRVGDCDIDIGNGFILHDVRMEIR